MIRKQVLAFGKSEKSEFIYIGSFGLSGVARIWGPNIGRSRRNRVRSHVCLVFLFMCWSFFCALGAKRRAMPIIVEVSSAGKDESTGVPTLNYSVSGGNDNSHQTLDHVLTELECVNKHLNRIEFCRSVLSNLHTREKSPPRSLRTGRSNPHDCLDK